MVDPLYSALVTTYILKILLLFPYNSVGRATTSNQIRSTTGNQIWWEPPLSLSWLKSSTFAKVELSWLWFLGLA